MNVFICDDIKQPISILNKDESHHCVRVLRMQLGDKVMLLNGNGTKAIGKIQSLSKSKVSVLIDELTTEKLPKQHLHICIAPTKSNDRIEWFLEKATELNCSEITFFSSFNSERKRINLERFQKQVIAACKQSKRVFFPKINDLQSFSNLIKTATKAKKYIATLHESSNEFFEFSHAESSLILIGPEGGFSTQEVELAISNNIQPILLGSQRLRTETAGVFSASVFYQKWFC